MSLNSELFKYEMWRNQQKDLPKNPNEILDLYFADNDNNKLFDDKIGEPINISIVNSELEQENTKEDSFIANLIQFANDLGVFDETKLSEKIKKDLIETRQFITELIQLGIIEEMNIKGKYRPILKIQ